jgi:CRISPR-associated protein (TIGR03986 family)
MTTPPRSDRTLPKQKTQISPNRVAIAPYNFVPLPEVIITVDPEREGAKHDRYMEGRHTGTIDCTLTTESPLYIRCGLTPEQIAQELQAKDCSDFFYLDPETHTPVIPGSSLRGLLRSLVEIVAYAKLDRMSSAPLVYRSIDGSSLAARYRDQIMQTDSYVRPYRYTPKVQGGYLEKVGPNRWQIRPAQHIGDTSFARIAHRTLESLHPQWRRNLTSRKGAAANTYDLYIQPSPFNYQSVRGGFLQVRYAKVFEASSQPKDGLIKAALLVSGNMGTKRSEAVIFPIDPQAEPIALSDEIIQAYRAQISKEQANLLDSRAEQAARPYMPTGLLRDGQPVLYINDGNTLFFGHTMMMRIPYPHKPIDFVPADLRDPEQIDLAEAIFGFVGKKKQKNPRHQAWAGRVFVSDAHAELYSWLHDEAITPHILSGPKATTFQHYLVQTDEDSKELKHYASEPGNDTVIRGHKQYWHKGDPSLDEITSATYAQLTPQERENDTQHTHIKPIASGSRFQAKIRFENLSNVELGALVWVLQLSDDSLHPGSKYRFKMGMGKPLGLGSLRIDSRLTLQEAHQRYSSLFSDTHDGVWATGETEQSPEVCLALSQAFEEHILAKLSKASLPIPTTNRLKDVLRIQMLLALLSWPGPQPIAAHTRYMEIERREQPRIGTDRNEYKQRPVLPTPVQVLANASGTPIQSTVPQRTAPQLPEVGEIFTGKILDIDGSVAALEVPHFSPPDTMAILRDFQGKRFRLGNTARVRVVAIRRIRNNTKTIVEVEIAPKE